MAPLDLVCGVGLLTTPRKKFNEDIWKKDVFI